MCSTITWDEEKVKYEQNSNMFKIFLKNVGATAIARRLRADDLFEASNYSARKIRFQLVSRDHMNFHCIMPKHIQIEMSKYA